MTPHHSTAGAQRPFFDAAHVGQAARLSADADSAGYRGRSRRKTARGSRHRPAQLARSWPTSCSPSSATSSRWALKRGRAAVFAQTGLGKSFMELEWGRAVHTGDRRQRAAAHAAGGGRRRWCARRRSSACRPSSAPRRPTSSRVSRSPTTPSCTTSTCRSSSGVILDESSILKAFDGKTRTMLIERCKDVPYRLCATATPAPNDFTELGNHAEFLGVMSLHGMQATFFCHDGGDTRHLAPEGPRRAGLLAVDVQLVGAAARSPRTWATRTAPTRCRRSSRSSTSSRWTASAP
jgi:hypothetical protein